MPKIEIKHRWNQTVLWSSDKPTMKEAVEEAIVSDADLSVADLRAANLRAANLSAANLSDANLRNANLSDAKIGVLNERRLSIVPEHGSFEGWKKCQDDVIVRLEIPADARRSNATGRKCRAERVRTLEVIGAEVGVSMKVPSVKYTPGAITECHEWDECRWNECSGGIHFFLTRAEAEAFSL